MQRQRRTVPAEEARQFIAASDFIWHQNWELAPGVRSPGANSVESLFAVSELPADLTGLSVLDIGTTNGGGAFEAERRGAARVVAVDVFDDRRFGFAELRAFLGSEVTFVQTDVYELPQALGGETFDVVLFWGVLYHLRHPVLALDCVRQVSRGSVMVETAICDAELDPAHRSEAFARFYRRDELGADPTNWFAPTQRLLVDWCESSGLAVQTSRSWPDHEPTRGHAACQVLPGVAEAHRISFESPIRASVEKITNS